MTERTESHAMSAIDGAWLRMDSETNPMIIHAVLVFAGPIDHVRLETTLRERLLPHARFRHRVAPSALPLGPPRWEADPHFDLATHLHRAALPAPAGDAELEALIEDLASSPLDHARPLWQMHHVEGYRGGSVLVARVHHAVGDGVALVGLLLSLTDEGAGFSPEVVGLAPEKVRGPFALAKQAAEQAVALGRILLLPAEKPSPLRGPLGIRKRMAWSRPLALDDLKAKARARSAKLNDLLLSAVAGALHHYVLAHGGEARSFRALVPVYVQGHATEGDLGNHFGLVFVDLPSEIAHPEERLLATKRVMDVVKSAPDALVALTVLAAMGMASEDIERLGIDIFTRKASLLVTNVPGPPMPLHFAGEELDTLLVWAPVSGNIGLGVSILSYAGSLRLGVSADVGVVSEPHEIVAAFEREVAAL
jgi:diacylglycerol O-acyltransferase